MDIEMLASAAFDELLAEMLFTTSRQSITSDATLTGPL
jgi:hypothetical protein